MRFKVSMIDYHLNRQKETVISNNEKEAKMDGITLNPDSTVLEAKCVYK